VALVGCTHRQLERSTALTANTVMSIHHQMVLDNMAKLTCHPEGLPSHVRLADGTVQVSDEAGWGESGGFTEFGGALFGIEQWGPSASRRVSEQWGTDAVGDPVQLYALQGLYRRALGLPPMDQPNFIAAAEANAAAKQKRDQESNGNKNSSNDSGNQNAAHRLRATDSDDDEIDDPFESSLVKHTLSAPEEVPAKLEELTVDQFDLPIGWFGTGRKCDVPKHACYVGRYGDCYTWVTADGVGGLTQFTLAVLSVIKLEDSPRTSSGMMYIP
jgi:hypothetical protein